ncbi:response regulator [Azospirillum halopraeferens]|uniref:response regulator n=1 Tax=Azospirillum halopraeferens TaxID=34010 RepID=UPI0003FBDC42|nr:response regulator [Azospirillum halopraeferens]
MTSFGTERRFSVLLVEDDPADAVLAERALARGPVPCDVRTVRDGAAALDVLRGPDAPTRRRVGDGTRPDLVLLDLDAPGMDGSALLGALKEDPDLRSIPVVVLTVPDAARDVEGCYRQGANSFVTKPADPEAYAALLHTLERYWFGTVRLPG